MIAEWLRSKRMDPDFIQGVARWETLPSRDAVYSEFPEELNPQIPEALRKRGVIYPYSHQRSAWDAVNRGEHTVVVTPTSSGKTMCYNIPVLHSILSGSGARALYLFPTKALGADQVASLTGLIDELGADIKTFTYDGDTPVAARKAIREAGHIVVTNPDMLHQNMLPNHLKWVKLFENLKYIVIDELHTYRGVFGSNMANVIRRLKRLCAFYGSSPTFICCSATIRNPVELARTILEEPITLVDDNGAPQGERHIIFYNPPVVNRQLGIRRSAVNETRSIALSLLRANISSIVFARSRLQVEVITTTLKHAARDPIGNTGKVRGYRSGYLPTERRDIERGLREGSVKTVVSTNALELGVDIGSLDACVLCGYPGTIASSWQQAGRAGRRQSDSVVILVATSSPLDQYIIAHPDYFLTESPENALAAPNNFHVLINHFKCAAYELPFRQDEPYGDLPDDDKNAYLDSLTDHHFLKKVGGRFHWMSEEFPAAEVHLRSAGDENFLIVDISRPGNHRIIGEMDRFTVPMLLHEQAIYLHEAKQYQVEQLDFPNHKAYVRSVDVEYYTDADLATTLRVLDVFEEADLIAGAKEDDAPAKAFGEVLVASMATIFKKIKMDTHENLGWGNIDLPDSQMHTNACWITLPALPDKIAIDSIELENGMMGLSHILGNIAPVHLMCAPRDICVHYHVRDSFTERPTIFLYDSIPGGVGLSDKAYELMPRILSDAKDAILSCPCENGCPSCVGPATEEINLKRQTLQALAMFDSLDMFDILDRVSI
ncbi:putative ATP-dependent helicase YprA [Clostridia bacterium]|nr:putative ATP-dependent helicase YprA [Clostridia bacterium]